eukprot:TRINITY_DN4821_c0_g2_i2.p1 TRINITY_DN4821_c0_g2~~TRINITY_DN4821_c0_g2_i2.p1  ORF type:complete len:161 (-),score=30.16 TRINITY_DN4821_c0_g2_i2:401-883(-)
MILDWFFLGGKVVFFEVGLAMFKIYEEEILESKLHENLIPLFSTFHSCSPSSLVKVIENELKWVTKELIEEMTGEEKYKQINETLSENLKKISKVENPQIINFNMTVCQSHQNVIVYCSKLDVVFVMSMVRLILEDVWSLSVCWIQLNKCQMTFYTSSSI